MTGRTLGLDLGSNSIGWALVDEAKATVVAAGVRVFPEGVDRDQQGGEVSKNENRRILRGQRRQIIRRSRRKRLLRAALFEAGLYPADAAEQARLDMLDPYALRRRALTEELSLQEIGRILIHLSQRRGFLSNRKADRSKKAENSKMLKEISDFAKRIADEQHATLGEHLAAHVAAPGESPTAAHRVRGQHTRREMFYQEFDAVWDAQRRFHPALLTDRLKYGEKGLQTFPAPAEFRKNRSLLDRYGLHGLLFYQRPLYWPLDAVGFCELEPRLRRCPRADRAAQRMRLLQDVNNLRYIDPADQSEKPLTPEQRSRLIDFLAAAASRTFDEIRKALGFPEDVHFNLERLVEGGAKSGGRTKLKGMETDALLAHKDLFGKSWYDRPAAQRDAIVRHLLDPAQDERSTLERAASEWGLSSAQAERLIDTELPAGYASYSRVALERLLPHMEAGLPLMRNDPPVPGESGPRDAIHAAGYLRPDERPNKPLSSLPGPGERGFPDLPNPIVQQALHEVRRIINAVIREHGRPDAIHIEMAREVKGSLEKRKQYRFDQLDRQRNRERAADEIAAAGIVPNRDAINRYLLWEAQERTCVYTGRAIGMAQLFGGEVDVDHILPRGRSLDNSMGNKVVCFKRANTDKGQRTPWEWLVRDGDAHYDYEQVLQRARAIGDYGKFKRFTQKEVVLDDFIARQLVDTAYISRAVVQFVRQLGTDVLCSKGSLTADLRWCWGLDRILSKDGLDVKNREDHRHHAVDAVVIALTNRSRLQQLARMRETGDVIADPWLDFRASVAAIINSINVSHRASRGVRGALHEQTVYGKVTERPGFYVSRQPLTALTPAMIPLIRDEVVRAKVEARLKEKGVDVGRGKGKIPPTVWKEPLWMNEAKQIRINKVRVCKPEESVVPLSRDGGQQTVYVKPGSLHHLCIFEFVEGKKTKREAVFISMLAAAKRKRDGEPIIRRTHPDRPDAKFIMSLSRGEAVLSPKGDGRLMIFNTAASTQGQIYFHHHCDARMAGQRDKFVVTANSMSRDTRKVAVDVLGHIRFSGHAVCDIALGEIDPRVLEIVRRGMQLRGTSVRSSEKQVLPGSDCWMRHEMKSAGLEHLGAQFSAAKRLLRSVQTQ